MEHTPDGRYVVMASYAGEDRDPAWAKNLRAYPRAKVTIGGRSTPVVARALEVAAAAGCGSAGLEVDGENSSGAQRLYEGLGFGTTHTWVSWSRVIPPLQET